MKVIVKKKNKPLILAILAGVLALLIAAAIIITLLNKKAAEEAKNPPVEIIEDIGEWELSGSAVAYPYVGETKFLTIRIKGENGEYALMRPKDGTVTTKDIAKDKHGNPITDKDGNPVYERVNTESFRLYYKDANGDMQVYYPAIADVDPSFSYEDMYAVEENDSIGSIYKIIYLVTAIGTTYFDQRIDLTEMTVDKRHEEYKKYGLFGNDAVEVSFTYIDDEKAESESHTVRIGDKLITGSGYYFTVDNRNYIYSTNVDYFSYALAEFTSYIRPVLTAEGLAMDKAFEPYLTTDFKHYVNFVHRGSDICKVKGCENGCVGVVGAADRVILDASAVTPFESQTAVSDERTDGYINESFKATLFELSNYKSDSSYQRLVKALLGKGVGAFASPITVTLPTFSKQVKLGDKYTYDIYAVEAILSDNGDITAEGTAIGADDLIRVTYIARKNGELVSVHDMHGVIDMSSELVPAEVKAKLTAVGELSEPARFEITYAKDNAVKRNIKMVVSDIVEVVDDKGNNADKDGNLLKVGKGTSVFYHYYLVIDGKKFDEEYSDAIEITDSLTGDAKQVAEALMGKTIKNDDDIVILSYDEYDEVFADFISYEIKGINYFVRSEIVASFEFQQASDRDPYYGESVYKNTLENENRIYALNSSVCEIIVKALGGVVGSSTGSAGLIGKETVAVGLTPETLDKYGLYAYTVYFEIPRGIVAAEYNTEEQEVSEYLNSLDDYEYYSKLGFTLYISEEQPDGTRYIASDLYDIVTKVDGENFIFLERSFVELYARRNIVLTNISNIKNLTLDFYMDEIYGSYSNELTHQTTYAYAGRLWSKEKLIETYGEEALSLATANDSIRVFTNQSDDAYDTKFGEFFKKNESWTVNGIGYGSSLGAFYENKTVELDLLGTSNFKELMEIIFYTRYQDVLSEEEQAEGLLNAPLLMKMSVTLGKAYSADTTGNAKEYDEGVYYASSIYDYVYEFYRISDRRVMVKLYRENRDTGDVYSEVSDFYISTFAFKKIVNGYASILNGENIDNNISYPENKK